MSGSVLVGCYDRTIVAHGRTEVLRVSEVDKEFAEWTFYESRLALDDRSEAFSGTNHIVLLEGAGVTFRRLGRGALAATFEAPTSPKPSLCSNGEYQVGHVTLVGNDEKKTLCDGARLVLESQSSTGHFSAPTVLAFSGRVEVGEEVRPGGGPQPILLHGEMTFLVRHRGWIIKGVCWGISAVQHFCDRFQVGGLTLSAGDTITPSTPQLTSTPPTTGFIRLDPSEVDPGVRFDLAAPVTTLQIRRLKGEEFNVGDSLFERAIRSPVSEALGIVVAAVSFLWGLCSLLMKSAAKPDIP